MVKAKVSSLNLKQYGNSHKMLFLRRIKIAGVSGTILIKVLYQFVDIPHIEYANAKLLNAPSCYGVQFTTNIDNGKDRTEHKDQRETIGVDFGCQTSLKRVPKADKSQK